MRFQKVYDQVMKNIVQKPDAPQQINEKPVEDKTDTVIAVAENAKKEIAVETKQS